MVELPAPDHNLPKKEKPGKQNVVVEVKKERRVA